MLGSPDAGRSPSRGSWLSGGRRVFRQPQEETGGWGEPQTQNGTTLEVASAIVGSDITCN